ncbi:Uncharacterised protein [uncultured archaeon]|nr:Uncharacterised protein [uncultured archaeon]
MVIREASAGGNMGDVDARILSALGGGSSLELGNAIFASRQPRSVSEQRGLEASEAAQQPRPIDASNTDTSSVGAAARGFYRILINEPPQTGNFLKARLLADPTELFASVAEFQKRRTGALPLADDPPVAVEGFPSPAGMANINAAILLYRRLRNYADEHPDDQPFVAAAFLNNPGETVSFLSGHVSERFRQLAGTTLNYYQTTPDVLGYPSDVNVAVNGAARLLQAVNLYVPPDHQVAVLHRVADAVRVADPSRRAAVAEAIGVAIEEAVNKDFPGSMIRFEVDDALRDVTVQEKQTLHDLSGLKRRRLAGRNSLTGQSVSSKELYGVPVLGAFVPAWGGIGRHIDGLEGDARKRETLHGVLWSVAVDDVKEALSAAFSGASQTFERDWTGVVRSWLKDSMQHPARGGFSANSPEYQATLTATKVVKEGNLPELHETQ